MMSDETAGSGPDFTAQPTTKWAVVVSDSGDVRFDWEQIGELAAKHGGDTIDAVPMWCVALLAARNAALEEAAKAAQDDTSFMMLQDFGMQSTCTQVRENIAAAIRALKT